MDKNESQTNHTELKPNTHTMHIGIIMLNTHFHFINIYTKNNSQKLTHTHIHNNHHHSTLTTANKHINISKN